LVTLFVYVVVAAGLRLPARAAGAVIGVTAAAVGAGLAAAGADSATLAAYILTVVTLGATMVAFASATRANRELHEARRELANRAVSEERLRIARDLHDLFGHTLSLIALKSELATKLAASDPRPAQAEMADVQPRSFQRRSRISWPGPCARRPRTSSATAAPASAGSTFPATRTRSHSRSRTTGPRLTQARATERA
jgi:two-component system, NarL family, sensor histidine kinase DesK